MNQKTMLVIVLLSASRSGLAQQTDTTRAIELKPVLISATRSEKKPLDVGRSITVISHEQITNSGANSLAELLSQQEGIGIIGAGQTPGSLQSLFTRGANSNQTNILIDGIKISDPSSTDNAVDLSELSLAAIERIEIVRGSHSTLYGSSAIGGVINIITRKNQLPGMHANVQLKTGTFGKGTSLLTENADLNYSFKNGFYINTGVFNTHVNGLNAIIDTITNPDNYKHQHQDNDDFDKTDLYGKIGYKASHWDLFASFKKVNQQADIDKGAYKDDDNYTTRFQRNLSSYGATYKPNEKLQLTYMGGITDLKHVFTDDSSMINVEGKYDGTYYTGTYKAAVFNNELQVNFDLKGINGVIGAGVQDEKMTFNTYYYSNTYGIYESRTDLDTLKINIKTINEFAHVDIDGSIVQERFKSFNLGLGIRHTHHRLFGNTITYEINPSLKVMEEGLLFASYSTGFNAPSLYQFYSPNKNFISGISRGNTTLKPETATSWEFGFKQQVNDKISFAVSYFKTIVENSIDYVYLWNKSKKTTDLTSADYRGDTYVNIGKQTNEGIELTINSRISGKLKINGNISLINGKLAYDPASIDTTHTSGNQVQLYSNGAFLAKEMETIGLVRRSSTANIGFTYQPFPKFSFTPSLKYVAPRNDIYYSSATGPYGSLATKGVAGYTLMDVLMQYVFIKNVSTTLRIENVFDIRYTEIYGYTTRGRGFYISLRYVI